MLSGLCMKNSDGQAEKHVCARLGAKRWVSLTVSLQSLPLCWFSLAGGPGECSVGVQLEITPRRVSSLFGFELWRSVAAVPARLEACLGAGMIFS